MVTKLSMVDKWFIWYSSQWLDWNNNQYNTIKSIQYYTRPRLIVISQAIGDKRIPKFISSGCDVFKSLSVAQTVCHWWISFNQQQIVQAIGFAQQCAGRTAQSAERNATGVCLVQRVFQTCKFWQFSCSQYVILYNFLEHVLCFLAFFIVYISCIKQCHSIPHKLVWKLP